jgi:hypothetical protein
MEDIYGRLTFLKIMLADDFIGGLCVDVETQTTNVRIGNRALAQKHFNRRQLLFTHNSVRLYMYASS